MYLAKHVGGWSTPRIGKFYNGRHHTTVLHAIRKVEQLRSADDSIDALVEMLTVALNPEMGAPAQERVHPKWRSIMIDLWPLGYWISWAEAYRARIFVRVRSINRRADRISRFTNSKHVCCCVDI